MMMLEIRRRSTWLHRRRDWAGLQAFVRTLSSFAWSSASAWHRTQ